MSLLWIFGASALKCILGFWLHMQMEAKKGSGKSAYVNRLVGTTGFMIFSSQLMKTDYRIVMLVSHSTMPVG